MSQSQGLEGVVATASSVSSIIDGVLSYQGYMIDDLADNASFEEVIFLLWNGYLPNKLELEKLEQELAFYSQIPETIIEQIKKATYRICSSHVNIKKCGLKLRNSRLRSRRPFRRGKST